MASNRADLEERDRVRIDDPRWVSMDSTTFKNMSSVIPDKKEETVVRWHTLGAMPCC